MKLQFEIKPAEGGNDSKLLVKNLTDMYLKYAETNKIKISDYQQINADVGWLKISFIIEGKEEQIKFLLNESGGHRFQRVSPTETKGRVHTSTVTVVVTEDINKQNIVFNDSDFDVKTKRGSGNGGQHRNKTDSMVVMTHISTGIKVGIDGRNQHQNKKKAREIVEKRIISRIDSIEKLKESEYKKSLAGTGERADKIRTYRYQDNIVIDHRSNKKCSLKDLEKGRFDKIIWFIPFALLLAKLLSIILS